MRGLIACSLVVPAIGQWGPFPDGVPGSGYGPCAQKGDVHYRIEATLASYKVPGSASIEDFDSTDDISTYVRTFVGKEGPFCSHSSEDGPYDGHDGILAPCMQVKPGQRMTIQIDNKMDLGMVKLNQTKDTLTDWWAMTQLDENGCPELLDCGESYQWTGERPSKPEDQIVLNVQDMPGWDVSFDDINLHIHGMQVAPHLFYPQGTNNDTAEWITITPRSENPSTTQFCYVFNIPDEHPSGTFWWHMHRHGSVTVQGWQGMVGLLKVGGLDVEGSPERELMQQGVVREEAFIIWEWSVDARHAIKPGLYGQSNYAYQESGTQDSDPAGAYLVNNAIMPEFEFAANEPVHMRVLSAQATAGSLFYIVDENGDMMNFAHFARDGISFTHAYMKNILMLGPGQREGIVVQLSNPGVYRVIQGEIADFAENDLHLGPGDVSDDVPMATIRVVASSKEFSVDLPGLKFTPGMPATIPEPADTTIEIDFQVGSELDKMPVAQFMIDNDPFDFRTISLRVAAGSVGRWQINSTMNFFHPFHIHINPFLTESIWKPEQLPGNLEKYWGQFHQPANAWRDTVFLPPYGSVTIKQKFAVGEVAWQGKTAFHCHYMDHEDQGMIHAFMIGPPKPFVV